MVQKRNSAISLQMSLSIHLSSRAASPSRSIQAFENDPSQSVVCPPDHILKKIAVSLRDRGEPWGDIICAVSLF